MQLQSFIAPGPSSTVVWKPVPSCLYAKRAWSHALQPVVAYKIFLSILLYYFLYFIPLLDLHVNIRQ